jgi:hypothetical protein
LQDFSYLYEKTRPSQALPWDLPEQRGSFEKRVSETLFGRRWATCIFDEAQGARNIGPKHFAALAILSISLIRLILTATPLQTSTKVGGVHQLPTHRAHSEQDLHAMARLVGIPYFFLAQALADEKLDGNAIRHAKQERAALGEDVEPEEDPLLIVQSSISARIQTQFEDRVIRRTKDSTAKDGSPLVVIPASTVLEVVLRLLDREVKILDRVTEADLDE